MSFAVITCHTPQFDCLVPGLKEDCSRLGYPLHCERLDVEFPTLVGAFDYKISFIRRMVEAFGRVLWLDAECRIVRPIPDHWASPLVSTYLIGKSQGISSGVLMLDREQQDFIVLWEKYAQKYPQYPDDFVFEFLTSVTSTTFTPVPFAFYDREAPVSVARGLWQNESTVIQHPTINRWPDPMKYRTTFGGKQRRRYSASESVSRQRKGIFYRNYGGDVQEIQTVMMEGIQQNYRCCEWVFDAVRQLYAPEIYWPEHADDFTSKPRSIDRSRENFEKRPAKQSFRESAVRSMRLDEDDTEKYGQPTPPYVAEVWHTLRNRLLSSG